MATTSRRRFVAGAAALPWALRAMADSKTMAAPPAPKTQYEPVRWVLFGTGKDGIYRASWNAANGALGPAELAVATDHPTFLAQHPVLPILYAANEPPTGDGAISSFHLDAGKGELKPLQQMSAKGSGTCFVSVDHAGNAVFAANYGGGSLAAYRLDERGKMAETASFFDCRDNPSCGALGPVKPNQQAAHLHSATMAPDNRYVLVCNLGEDAIEVFPVNSHGDEPLGRPTRVSVRAGSGPRHVAFHPNKRWVYCAHELDCTVDLFDWKVEHGMPQLNVRDDSMMPLFPAGTDLAGKSGCEIEVSPDGKYVYANTRGPSWMVVYAVDKSTGLLTEIQRVSTGADVTRHFAFDPSRRWLVCANQGSSTVTVQAHDPASGRLSGKPVSYPVGVPMYVHFL
jgi:6-phosphogluconolactonase